VVTRAAGLLEEVPVLSRAVWAWAEWASAKVNSVALTAATTHTTTATAAVATPGVTPMLSQLTLLIAGGNLANHVGSARRATSRRCPAASSTVAEHRLRTCSRS
jgi:hypothetical protein